MDQKDDSNHESRSGGIPSQTCIGQVRHVQVAWAMISLACVSVCHIKQCNNLSGSDYTGTN